MNMKKNRKINGAGLIVISKDLKKVLTLWKNNKLDLPKGSIERGETPIQTAFREGFEEAGIKFEDCEFAVDYPGIFENVQFYYVFYNGSITLAKNPVTGVLEHDKVIWLPWRRAIDKAPDFLKPPLFHGLAITAVLPRRGQK
jgi:8-oxo-dGTP pyrophosphatase MutT (NUDIX family)